MRNDKITNFRLLILILIFIVTIAELTFIYRLNVDYKGVYEAFVFVPFILLQSFIWYQVLLKNNTSKYYMLKIVCMVLITIFIPVSILTTVPEYTYQEGKTIIESSNNFDSSYYFSENYKGVNTIPVSDNPKGLLVANRAYYYALSNGTNDMFFIVSPVDGSLVQLANDFTKKNEVNN